MIFQKLLSTYVFDSGHQFLLSLFPSFKYGVQQMSITLSIVSGCIANFLGLRACSACRHLRPVYGGGRRDCFRIEGKQETGGAFRVLQVLEVYH